MMSPQTRSLFDSLAKELKLPNFVPDQAGGIQLIVGKRNVFVYAQSDGFILIAVPAVALPSKTDYAVAHWLLHRNFYDSDLAPFRIATDAGGTVLLWGRVPVEGLTGAALAGLVDAVAAEAERVQKEVEG